MASLNLNPNPAVLVTQAGIFLTALFVVKKTMIEPYLKVRTKREQKTLGNQSEADSILVANAEAAARLDAKLHEAATDAKVFAAKIRADANKTKEQLVKEAQENALKTIKAIESDIENTVKEEKQKIPQIVEALASDCFQRTIN